LPYGDDRESNVAYKTELKGSMIGKRPEYNHQKVGQRFLSIHDTIDLTVPLPPIAFTYCWASDDLIAGSYSSEPTNLTIAPSVSSILKGKA
jgi:hypothetical protein